MQTWVKVRNTISERIESNVVTNNEMCVYEVMLLSHGRCGVMVRWRDNMPHLKNSLDHIFSRLSFRWRAFGKINNHSLGAGAYPHFLRLLRLLLLPKPSATNASL